MTQTCTGFFEFYKLTIVLTVSQLSFILGNSSKILQVSIIKILILFTVRKRTVVCYASVQS